VVGIFVRRVGRLFLFFVNELVYRFKIKIWKEFCTSKPSEPDYFEEHQFMTNWYEINHDGWHLPGTKEEHDWCGLWQTRGCLNVKEHKGEHENQIFVKRYPRSCYRADCKKCFKKWIARQANRSTRRVQEYAKRSAMRAIHIMISVPKHNRHLPVPMLKKRAINILKEWGINGVLIFHPFRFNKNRKFYYSPHFHVIGFGWIKSVREFHARFGWFVKYMGVRKSIFQTFYYLLSHCGIKKRQHALTWFGTLSYSKLKLEKEPDSNICPVCNKKLVLLYYNGLHPVVPPDTIFEDFVDPFDWYEVQTIPNSEWTRQDRYEYALTKELYDANKGVAITS